MAATAAVLQVIIEAKGAEQASSKIDKVNAALSKIDGVAGGSSRSIDRIGQSAEHAAGQARTMQDQFGKPIVVKGQESFDTLSRSVERSQSSVGRLGVEVKQTGTKAKKAGEDSKGFADVFRNLPGVAKVAALSAGLVGLKLALAGVARATTEAFRPIIDLENSVNRFNTAMASVGQFSAQATRNALAFASSMEQITTFSDDAVLTTQALIAQIGQIGGVTLERATRAALDLSAAIGTDLRTAAIGMGKAAKGNTDTLSEYGIVIGANVPKAERFAAAIALVEQTFGGAAQGQIATFEGSLKQLSNEWDNLRKRFTAPFIPILTQTVKGLKSAIDALSKSVGGAGVIGLGDSVVDDIANAQKEVTKIAGQIGPFALTVDPTGLEDELQTIAARLSGAEVQIKAVIFGGSLKDAIKETDRLRVAADDAEGALGGMFERFASFAEQELKTRIELDDKEFQTTVADLFSLTRRDLTVAAKLTLVGDESIDEANARWTSFLESENIGPRLQVDDSNLDALVARFNSITNEDFLVQFKADLQGLGEQELLATAEAIKTTYAKLTEIAIEFAAANHDSAGAAAALKDRYAELLPLIGEALNFQLDSGNIFDQLAPPTTIFDSVPRSAAAAVSATAAKFATLPGQVTPVMSELAQTAESVLGSGLSNILAAPFLSMLDQTRSFGENMLDAVKQMVASMIKELAKLAIFSLFKTILSGGTSTIFDGIKQSIFEKGGFGPPNPPTGNKPGGGQAALFQPPSVLEFSRRTPASEFSAANFRGALQIDDAPQRSQLVQPASAQRVDITINAMDSKDIERSLRNGELGRAFANLSRTGR